MEYKLKHYYQHNYHNDKVVQWVIDNLNPTEIDPNSSHPACACVAYEKKNGEGYFLFDEERKEFGEKYYDYFDRYDTEYLVEEIAGLSEEEKDELLTIENLRVYYCPFCESWSLDGDNL